MNPTTHTHKRGDTFYLLLQLPARFPDGMFADWTVTSQLRTVRGQLIDDIAVAWADTGTLGDVLAPQLLHPLITHATAHRARGLAELSDTGTQEHITLTMQVLPETGVITPGQVVRYLGHDKDYLGIVRATSLNWSSPKLRQSIVLETHP